jgi:phosphoribosylformylglycinamidine synthase
MRIDLDKVPTRQSGMKPFEILLSESQERMLIVAHKGQEDKLLAIFDKWDLECEIIGEVTDSGRLQYFQHGEMVADVPAEPLVLGGGAPVYQRKYTKPKYLKKVEKFNLETVKLPASYIAAAKKLWKSPNIVSKRWVYEQYDSMIRTNTQTTNSPSDAAVVRVKGTEKAIALTTDCNSAYVYADPHKGGMIAVAEAARNIVCSGGEPVAITNCLNFGNPYNPEVFYQFVYAVQGMGDACRKFDTPVTGGNVSFYNQANIKGKIEPVYPTPTIGMLGILDDATKQMTLDFKNEGDLVYLVGKAQNDLGSSEYLRYIKKIKFSNCPYFDLEEEFALQQTIKALIANNLVQSAHDISEGGLFSTLVEKSMVRGLGFEVVTDNNFRKDAYLFGESQSRVVVSVSPSQKAEFEALASKSGITLLGKVQGKNIVIDGEDYGAIARWKKGYDTELGAIMEKE